MSGSTVSSVSSSRGLGAFSKSGSSKTLSVSGSSFGGSFNKPSNAANATMISSLLGSEPQLGEEYTERVDFYSLGVPHCPR
ncbi:hypothetical protein GN244_ATG05093 [Phytophthora infestans]|uniref:Uncharacterized protein n=1 Tax=Phytophthora infestans TaxID=4787 RepID=A0A833WMW4_PHYIN|nr:hypothetical protein GN244_ATG05093 [Phytophthora infestans]KAF4139059.1 hypothetical protein GN958_ATG11721 [Phytophthora infestans]